MNKYSYQTLLLQAVSRPKQFASSATDFSPVNRRLRPWRATWFGEECFQMDPNLTRPRPFRRQLLELRICPEKGNKENFTVKIGYKTAQLKPT